MHLLTLLEFLADRPHYHGDVTKAMNAQTEKVQMAFVANDSALIKNQFSNHYQPNPSDVVQHQ